MILTTMSETSSCRIVRLETRIGSYVLIFAQLPLSFFVVSRRIRSERPVVMASGELRRLLEGVATRRGRVGVGGGRCRPAAAAVRRVALEQRAGPRGVGAEAVGEVVVVVAGSSVRRTAVGAAGVLVIPQSVALVHVDGGVGFLVMGRHGEGGLVRVDVGAAGELILVVAGEVAVGPPGLVGGEAKEDADAPGKAREIGMLVLRWFSGENQGGFLLRRDDAEADDSLALTTGIAAVVGGVVSGLGSKGREPDYGEEDVNDEHGNGVGEVARAVPSRSHEQIYPGGYG